MQRVERYALALDVNLVAVLVAARDVHPVAHFALECHIRHQPLHRLGIYARQISRVGIAVWVSIGDIEEQHEIMPLGWIEMNLCPSLCAREGAHSCLLSASFHP